ncbi:hypothetical protein B9Z55_026135 [Caenorhabditis nigoni]|uniref:F-box domain-containing protein n=1 Tax=Caenorhabditis nigoni TaxID=1611254 RepID=A0A2G5T1Y9_9PELO|nr:hypothetical protein B9Z55_026135 [Caenorhabditis nigoni]
MNRDFSPPNLDTMPNNALKEILNYLNIKERSVLRKVNRTLRKAVDNNHTTVNVALNFWDDSISLNLDGIGIEYSVEDEDKCEIQVGRTSKILDSDYVETAMNDLGVHFKNPNTRIKNLKLNWEFSEELFDILVRILRTFFDELTQNGGSGFFVENLHIEDNDGDNIGQVLTMIDVNTITSLRINCDGAHLRDEEQFLDLLQWQRVRDFRLIGDVEPPNHILNALRNVSFFHIDQDNDNMEVTFERIFIFILTVLNQSDNFEHGQITTRNLDIPAPFINAHLILGNVSVSFKQNRITMEKYE